MKESTINVWRKVKAIVAHVGDPEYDTFWRNSFVPVKFIDQDGNVIKNQLFAGHMDRLTMLEEGTQVDLVYDTVTKWIKSINGERWN